MKRLLLLIPFLLSACDGGLAPTVASTAPGNVHADATCTIETFEYERGFDEFGYNNCAQIFNGTGASWSTEQGLPADYLGIYASDKLIMKWNSEWDRGNAEKWSNPPYAAWEDNEWNGQVPGGSGETWHYKIVWSADCKNGVPPTGGYCVWGEFEMIFSAGTVANQHIWDAHVKPTGYGG